MNTLDIERSAMADLSDVQALRWMIDLNEHDLVTFAQTEKVIKIDGERYTILGASIMSACAFSGDERNVILQDIREALLNYLIHQTIAELAE